MPYKVVDLKKIIKQYNCFCENPIVDENSLDENHLRIRKFFIQNYYDLKTKNLSKYEFDLQLGLRFYEFMEREKDFNHLYRSNYDFWRYVAVFDIPDIIADRFGINNIMHFYKKTSRTYPYILYWYIYMSWQGNKIDTYEILKDNSTDEIMQLVERPSMIGINVDLYRNIMKKYSLVPKNFRNIMIDGKWKTLFRVILIKNTSKLTVIRPELYPGGVDGYVDMLFDKNASYWR